MYSPVWKKHTALFSTLNCMKIILKSTKYQIFLFSFYNVKMKEKYAGTFAMKRKLTRDDEHKE